MRKTFILSFIVAVALCTAAVAGATNYYQHVVTTTTTSTQTICVVNQNGPHPGSSNGNGDIQAGDTVITYSASSNCHGQNIGNGNSNSAHYAKVSRSVTTTTTSTVCNTTAEGASAGPFSDSNCTTPVVNNGVTGWPSGSGTASGDFTCSPVTLTSTDDANGFGAIDFDGPFGTFATLPIFSSSNYSILSGTGAESEPYLIVRFSDSTEVFVYATDVTGPGTRYSDDVNHNTYLTRSQALASYGTKQVSSVTLAVDNGDLSIQVNGVGLDNCGQSAVLPPPPNHMFLCYSKFQTDGGQVFTNDEALAILADPSIVGWASAWAPDAVLGTTDAGPNISGYHLACNPTGVTPTGNYLYANNDGSAEIVPFDALVAGSAGYPIAG